MDTRSLIEESEKPKAHLYYGDGTYRKVVGRRQLYSTVRPKNLPGYATVAIGPEGVGEPEVYVCALNGKPFKDGEGYASKPCIYTEREHAQSDVALYANREWRPVNLDLEVWKPLEPIVEEDDGAQVLDWPLAAFAVRLDDIKQEYDRAARRRALERKFKQHLGRSPRHGYTRWTHYPKMLAGQTSRLTADELTNLFQRYVRKVQKSCDRLDVDFVRWMAYEFTGVALAGKAFNRGYRVDDFGYEGQDNYALMDDVLAKVATKMKSKHDNWRTRDRGGPVETEGENMIGMWTKFKAKINRKRSKGKHEFSYD